MPSSIQTFPTYIDILIDLGPWPKYLNLRLRWVRCPTTAVGALGALAGLNSIFQEQAMPSQEWLQKQFSESELILGLIGAVGTEMTKVREILKNRLELHGYTVVIIGISKDIIPMIVNSLK